MGTRIHIVIDEVDKARYRTQAEREGKSLAAWLREAAEQKLEASVRRTSLSTGADLKAFFDECDVREGRPEPDWEDHRRVIERSRTEDSELT